MKNHISVCWIASKLLGKHLQMLLVLSHTTKTRSPIAPRPGKFLESRFRCLLVEPVELVQQGTTWVLLYQSLPLLRGTLWLWLPPCTLQSTHTIQHCHRLLRLSLFFEEKHPGKVKSDGSLVNMWGRACDCLISIIRHCRTCLW